MESSKLLLTNECKDNNLKKEIEVKQTPYFIVIQKKDDKQIKIPCSNETIARKVLASYKGLSI